MHPGRRTRFGSAQFHDRRARRQATIPIRYRRDLTRMLGGSFALSHDMEVTCEAPFAATAPFQQVALMTSSLHCFASVRDPFASFRDPLHFDNTFLKNDDPQLSCLA